MEMETKHGEMQHSDWKEKMMHWHSKSWSGWKSPVGLGFFLLTASLALAILLYTGLNFAVSVTELAHPAGSQAMSAQEQQAMEQEMQSSGGSDAAAGAPATTGQ